jgi:hypothetical protein
MISSSQFGPSRLWRCDLLARFQTRIDGQGGEYFSMPNLEFFPLIWCEQRPSGSNRCQIFLRLEGHIEGCRSFRPVQHLTVIFTDVGSRAVSIMHLAEGEVRMGPRTDSHPLVVSSSP